MKKKGGLTPVTYESFVAWKARKAEERKKSEVAEAYKKLEAARAIKGKSGRDLFNQLLSTNADLFMDDDEVDDDWMVRDHGSDDEEAEIFDIQVTGTSFALKKVEKTDSGTGASVGGKTYAGDNDAAAAQLAAGVDASLFLDDDVELPSDDD